MGGRKKGSALGLRAAETVEAHQVTGNNHHPPLTPKRKNGGVSEDVKMCSLSHDSPSPGVVQD